VKKSTAKKSEALDYFYKKSKGGQVSESEEISEESIKKKSNFEDVSGYDDFEASGSGKYE